MTPVLQTTPSEPQHGIAAHHHSAVILKDRCPHRQVFRRWGGGVKDLRLFWGITRSRYLEGYANVGDAQAGVPG